MRRCATLAISPIVTEPCGPCTAPPSHRTSAGSHCRRCAPMRHNLSRNMRLARATAPPDITMLREANVPKPNAVLSVSPCRTEICDGSIPSSWQAICDSVVSSPWPCDWMPTCSTRLPSGRMRAVQLSKPGMIEAPREANSAAPCAVCSVKDAKPMPISRPSASPCFCRARIAGMSSNSAQSRTLAG